jgi:hypothetical protein
MNDEGDYFTNCFEGDNGIWYHVGIVGRKDLKNKLDLVDCFRSNNYGYLKVKRSIIMRMYKQKKIKPLPFAWLHKILIYKS